MGQFPYSLTPSLGEPMKQEMKRGTTTDTTMQRQHADDDPIVAEDGTEYPADIYEETGRAVGTQQWVANQWMRMKLPTHTNGILRSSTGNFKGIQRTDGSGKLKHYSTIEGIRTINGIFISNSGCYARGWAHCSTPSNSVTARRTTLPLTTMNARRRYEDDPAPGLRHIVDVVKTEDDYNGYDRLVVYDDDSIVFASREKVEGVKEPFDIRDAEDFLTETNTTYDF